MKTHTYLKNGVLVAMGALAVVLVSGCGGVPGDNTRPASANPNPPTPAPAQSAAPGSISVSRSVHAGAPPVTPPVAPPGQAPAPNALPECLVSDLRLELGQGDGAAGTVYRPLRFVNVGGRTCFTHGFPGVSYVAGDDGHQVGPAAVRDGEKGDPVSLSPGQVGFATVGFVNVRNYDEAVCQPTLVRGLRVYPPQETNSVFVPMDGAEGCAANPPGQQLTVLAVRPGTGG